jgi:hypothetical protein
MWMFLNWGCLYYIKWLWDFFFFNCLRKMNQKSHVWFEFAFCIRVTSYSYQI